MWIHNEELTGWIVGWNFIGFRHQHDIKAIEFLKLAIGVARIDRRFWMPIVLWM